MPNIGQEKQPIQKEPSYFSRQIRAARRFYNPGIPMDPGSIKPFFVFAGGWESCSKGYRIERNNFPYYTLEFVVAGCGVAALDGVEHELIPGDFFSYGPDIPHIILNDGDQPLEKYFLNLLCTEPESFLGTETDLYAKFLHSVRPHSIQQTFEELTIYGIEQNRWNTKICRSLVQLLVLKVAESSISSEDYSGIAYSNYLRCLSILNQQYLAFATLDDIADACYIDTSYLCRLFKKFNHQSPYQYFLRLNMNHAADLLLQKKYQVQEVAEIMNYSDPQHFSRTFRKVMGISPSAFIRLSMDNPEEKKATDRQ